MTGLPSTRREQLETHFVRTVLIWILLGPGIDRIFLSVRLLIADSL